MRNVNENPANNSLTYILQTNAIFLVILKIIVAFRKQCQQSSKHQRVRPFQTKYYCSLSQPVVSGGGNGIAQ